MMSNYSNSGCHDFEKVAEEHLFPTPSREMPFFGTKRSLAIVRPDEGHIIINANATVKSSTKNIAKIKALIKSQL